MKRVRYVYDKMRPRRRDFYEPVSDDSILLGQPKPDEYSPYLYKRQKKLNIFLRVVTSKRFLTISALIIAFHAWLHLANPYATINFVQTPYTTHVVNGQIRYEKHFDLIVRTDPVSDLLGYYRQGFLIVQNTFFGGARLPGDTSNDIIDGIHHVRFNPEKPYLISGDQFSVLYPRNLGVFYNQLLDPNTAHSPEEWQDRQRIYLQSVLYAIDGLSASDDPKTTLVPLSMKSVALTSVHPGGVSSDGVYGVLYALDRMNQTKQSKDGEYSIQTQSAVKRILKEKKPQLKKMIKNYVDTVQDPETTLVRSNLHMAAARDGVTRKSSFYDNVVLWKTLELGNKMGLYDMTQERIDDLHARINETFWNESQGYYNNDLYDKSFSSDWLLAYVTGFLDITKPQDKARTLKTLAYIDKHNIADPLPIKYQIGDAKNKPFIIDKFVPNYGADLIWSYWGAEYMTLLLNVYSETSDSKYLEQARHYINEYNQAIVRDGGFAETFSLAGDFFRTRLYKSIRVTGWVVQFEHALELEEELSKD